MSASRLLRRLGVLRIDWVREASGPLREVLPTHVMHPRRTPHQAVIDKRVAATDELGARPLWDGYGQVGAVRTPQKVRTPTSLGRVYFHLTRRLRPRVIVEFGTAFGVSGMYWLSGLETNGSGHLFTYDPNENWLTVARDNLSAVSSKFTSTLGTFEENVDRTLGERRVDVAFIDAIHTPEFVRPQFELVAERLTPGGVVIVDDIHFSPEMASLWTQLARDSRVLASCALSGRAGLLQLR